MKFVSTRGSAPAVGFLDAVEAGLAPDGGLYVPETYPKLSDPFIKKLSELSIHEICWEVLGTFVGNEIPIKILEQLVCESINFDAPLVKLSQDIYVLELFHGPTLAFKDFGVRFMARLLAYLSKGDLVVLTATSGDTGAAVASAFHGLPNMRAVVLYPSGKVSTFQEKQIAGLGANVTALEVEGSFDDCQRLVKQAFQDAELRLKMHLVSANSINLARLLPQIAYYFRAWGQLADCSRDVLFSVPSGNFGDLTAGLAAKEMGLPVTRFVTATNANDVVPRFLQSGTYEPRKVVATMSNAMDIADPSNFARILSLYKNDIEALRKDVVGYAVSDKETKIGLKELYDNFAHVADPHGTVAYLALKKALRTERGLGIFLETAHPAKFTQVMEEVLKVSCEIPPAHRGILERQKISTKIPVYYQELRDILLGFLPYGAPLLL